MTKQKRHSNMFYSSARDRNQKADDCIHTRIRIRPEQGTSPITMTRFKEPSHSISRGESQRFDLSTVKERNRKLWLGPHVSERELVQNIVRNTVRIDFSQSHLVVERPTSLKGIHFKTNSPTGQPTIKTQEGRVFEKRRSAVSGSL